MGPRIKKKTLRPPPIIGAGCRDVNKWQGRSSSLDLQSASAFGFASLPDYRTAMPQGSLTLRHTTCSGFRLRPGRCNFGVNPDFSPVKAWIDIAVEMDRDEDRCPFSK